QLSVTIEGLGQFRGDQFTSQRATVNVKGSGNVYVRAEESLNATVEGLGSITYYGNPRVTPVVSGAGSIKPGN
nr:DUF2807 domain-containing protein [Chloroflexaceae bacterium]